MSTALSSGKLYKRLWRWHFWAAFLVIPFVLLQASTGTLYVWANEWADWAHPEARFVTPALQRAPLEDQVNAALSEVLASYPGAKAERLLLSDSPQRSSLLLFDDGSGLEIASFIDPYRAEVLAVLGPWQWLPGWSRALHGGWPFGKYGSWFLELAACWCMVMIATGVYLWWPRGISFGRALLPRLGQGQRVLWRDLHACVAVWISLLTLAFLLTALPWTEFWGKQVLRPMQVALNQSGPGFGARGLASTPQEAALPLTLDQAVALGRAQGLSGQVEIRMAYAPTDALQMRSRRARASDEVQVLADRYSGEVLRRTTWADYKIIPKAIATGVDLHEGTFFGRANQWLNTLLSLALIWLCLTGLVSWYVRRPGKGLAAPARQVPPAPRWLSAAAIVSGIALPLLGLSLLLLYLLDTLTQRFWPKPV